jgi:hypothetical protein
MENKLDGNATAGILETIFPFDMTIAEGTCANCGATKPLATAAAYMSQMGAVMRCPTCDSVLIRAANVRGRYMLDLQGLRVLQIRAEDNPPSTATISGA